MVRLTAFEMTTEKLRKQFPQRKAKPFCTVQNGRLLVGTQSLHRTVESRMWRTIIRLRQARTTKVAK